jgi:hypothetical protein
MRFLRKIRPIELVFLILILCRIFLSPLTLLLHFPHNLSNWSSSFFSNTTFQNFQCIYTRIYCPKCPSFSTIQSYNLNVEFC